MTHKFDLKLGNGNITIETGRMAKQADGAVTVQLGGTVVLATAVCSKSMRPDIDFFPLTVEYQEKTYAAGKIPGGWFKREGRPTGKEILTSRLIDRPIRPLFPKGLVNDVQVVALVLSSDGENDSDVLAMIGASAALTISDVPFNGPMGAVRVGRIDGKFITNPTFKELEKSDLDLVVAGTRSAVTMIESGSRELSEEVMVDAIAYAHGEIQAVIDIQDRMAKQLGVEKRDYEAHLPQEELVKKIKDASVSKLEEINKLSTKEQRQEAMDLLAQELIEKYAAEGSEYTAKAVKAALDVVEEENVRRYIIEKRKRVDGRAIDEVRQITCEVGVLPRTHGSGLFTRGQTQSLSVTTLGTSADEQVIEALEGEISKNFMLHYNFPPFSVGEAKPMRGPGRREIGHGALAERALQAVMPSKDQFPYTVRVVSEILESNGSSSMATVCASTLSLMDAGVPITKPVSGIAMGLVKEGREEIVLTDIGGVEDHYGDMDFKVAGTVDGITAVQMDLKIEGISVELIKKAFAAAKKARLFIMDKMLQAISRPKEKISDFAPHIVSFKIPQDKIGEVIGPGGKNIKKIIQDTGVTIDIDDDGIVQVASQDGAAIEKAVNIIKGMTEMPEVGKIYTGPVVRILNFGAFVEIMPGRDGLIHVSELDSKFVKNVEDVVKVGDVVSVKVIGIDEQGRVNLSKKRADPNYVPGPDDDKPQEPRPSRGRPRR
jgi:polyribonucleotide nucleotidyltransferase